jgi:hypothetical protein
MVFSYIFFLMDIGHADRVPKLEGYDSYTDDTAWFNTLYIKKSVIGLIPDSKPGNGFSFGLKLGSVNFYFGYFRPIRSFQLLLSGKRFVPRPTFNRQDYYIIRRF